MFWMHLLLPSSSLKMQPAGSSRMWVPISWTVQHLISDLFTMSFPYTHVWSPLESMKVRVDLGQMRSRPWWCIGSICMQEILCRLDLLASLPIGFLYAHWDCCKQFLLFHPAVSQNEFYSNDPATGLKFHRS